MKDRLQPIDEVTVRKALLPEIVREYLRYGDLVKSPFIDIFDIQRMNMERIGMLGVMKPEEKGALADFGTWMEKRVQGGNRK